jgi:hypothetical protein
MKTLWLVPFLCSLAWSQGIGGNAGIGGKAGLGGGSVVIIGSCGTIVRYSNSASTGSSAGITSVTLASGDHVLVLMSENSSGGGVYITSVTGQTGYRIPFWQNQYIGGSFAGGTRSAYYITSASAITGATLTVNFSASATTPYLFAFRVPDVSGTAAIDAISAYSLADNTSTSLVQVPIYISGSDDCIIGLSGNTSSVSSPWNTNFSTTNSTDNYTGTSWLSNITSSPATPTWSNANGNGQPGVFEFALGYNVLPSAQWALMDNSGGTSTVEPTATTLHSSLFGAAIDGTASNSGNFAVTDATGSSIEYIGSTGDSCTSASHPLLNSPPRFLYSGQTYPNSSTLGLAFSLANSGSQNSTVQWNLPGASLTFPYMIQSTTTTSMDFCSTVLATDTVTEHALVTVTNGTGDSPNIQLIANGSTLLLECATAGAGSCLNGLNPGVAAPLTYTSGTWVKFNMQVNGGLAAQSPSSPTSLSAGSNTITLASGCPFNPNAPYYIAGTGTAEFVQPTSTTCTSGAASGTITVTTVNPHSSGYTVQPASPMTILSDTGTVLATFYGSASADLPEAARIGIPSPTTVSGRKFYYDKWAFCYDMINGGICPPTITP